MQRIYLDNNATTLVDPRVVKIVCDDLSGPPANPSSVHWFGIKAKQKLMEAREKCAIFFHSKPEEILFTSSGTESISLMLNGLNRKGHLITTNIEHSAMEKAIQKLEKEGMRVTWLECGITGAPDPDRVEQAITSDTQALVFSLSNSETGVRLDLERMCAIAEKKGIPLLLDGVAYIGKEIFFQHSAIQAVAISGHKFHAPKGTGLL
ncbi:MAG: aminotransferase class V-fold PLP-dependent enzyme, partial [Chlamydiia bacterium]|nr:aminotransferase class V-fold PLP-dependent enzyme [Chlamydiia bacterium]